jgi:hypothetical protein
VIPRRLVTTSISNCLGKLLTIATWCRLLPGIGAAGALWMFDREVYLSMPVTSAGRPLLPDIVTGESRRLKPPSPGLSRFE